jgi:dihydrodipicolinate synthase/N-acetylneuraminate lyase
MPPQDVLESLRKGGVIPAHPLALDRNHKFDERRQRALTRYYMAAGADGVAVGVHTTQFAIREAKVGLFRPVLEIARETIVAHQPKKRPPVIRIAGICGGTRQAVAEARLAADLGYHIGLLSLGALAKAPVEKLLDHARAVSQVMPLMGFYLQPSVGGRILGFDFWRRFVEIENVVAIKIAPFNRYQTLDVVRAVVEAGRTKEVVLYTGNDDNIINDLLTQFLFDKNKSSKPVRIVGGLLGHWAVWTRRAVTQLLECHRIVEHQRVPIPPRMLTLAAQVTDSNAAFFDPANGFAGCIAGIHEVLRRQGLLEGIWCLDPKEGLSPGQSEEIDRVYAAYPHLNDDSFVAEHLDHWLQ